MNNASKMVSSAILGLDYRVVVVNSKSYIIKPPTIARLAGAAFWLSTVESGDTLHELLLSMKKIENVCNCLSWLIKGNDSLSKELSKGTLNEVVTALETGFQLVDVANFIRLSALTKSAANLIAKPK